MRETISNVNSGLCLHLSCDPGGDGKLSGTWKGANVLAQTRTTRGCRARGDGRDGMPPFPDSANSRQSLNSLYFRRVCLKGAERNA
jgi:hypothetical protein